jgi:MFS family permease
MADLRGRRWVMVISLLLYGLAGLSICLVSSFKWLLFLRTLQGVGYSGVMPLVVVLIGDSYTKEQETAAQGMKVFVDRVGTLCLPPLAGMLGVVAWQAPFVLYGLAIPLAICVLIWIPEPEIIKHDRILPYFKDVFILIRRLYCLTIFSISSLRHFLQVGFFTYLPIFAIEKLGISMAKGGFLFTVYAVGAMITSSQLGVLAMRYQRINLVIFAFLIQGICLLTVPAVPGVLWLGVTMIFFGLANGIISPSHKSLLTQSAPGKLRGGVVSVDRVLQNICKTVSPLIAGLILSLRSTEIVFYVLGAIALVWVTSALVLHTGGYLQRDKDLKTDIAA